MPLSRRPKRQGRPKDAVKRAAIVAAAEALFMRHPIDAVTMEAVATAAGVSKMTVYGHFRDKESLFVELVRAFSERMMATPPDLPESAALGPRLEALGRSFLGQVLSPLAVRMKHALIATLHKDHDLAARIYDAGPARTRQVLATIIAAGMQSGELRPDDPLLAAEDLLSLWAADLPGRLACGLEAPMTDAEIAARARRGTGVFLRAYGAAGQGMP